MGTHSGKSHRIWKWIGISTLIVCAVLAAVVEIALHRANPIIKKRVIETLSARFNSRVELDRFSVSIAQGLNVNGGGLRIFPPDDIVKAGVNVPIIAVDRFEFRTALAGLFIKPMKVDAVHVSGLHIHIPPRELRQMSASTIRSGKMEISVEEFICEDSVLVLGTSKPDKDPRVFELQHIELRNIGADSPWRYDATLVNAVPRGNIHSVGMFGPWQTESPGDSSVTGHYTFDNADLNTIKGIGGILASVGDFKGQLDRIEVQGEARVPNFSLDTANHPVPLHTRFHATVDGTSGDTYFEQIEAKLGSTEFTCKGAVINVRGRGHIVDLGVNVPAGQLRDFLMLAVKSSPPVMSGIIKMKSNLRIDPGDKRVIEKLRMKGQFVLTRVHFANPEVQDKVDMLSLRASGQPKEAKPGAEDVESTITGDFSAAREKLTFQKLEYSLPGATVALQGVYSMDGRQFDFRGDVRTKAKLSQMVASRWKSWLLKPVDPFFRKHDAGAQIPVKVTGTNSAPKFGVDFGGSKLEQAQE